MTRRQRTGLGGAVIVLCLALGAALPLRAQGHGGGKGGGGMGGGQFPGGARPMEPGSRDGAGPRDRARGNEGRTSVQLGPPERWWDDQSFVKSLKLRPEQQAHMDAIFEQNRSVLVERLQSLQQAEAQMQAIAKAAAPDQNALFAQIDRVAQARAELEKADTRMVLQLRKELDAGQLKQLEKASQQ